MESFRLLHMTCLSPVSYYGNNASTGPGYCWRSLWCKDKFSVKDHPLGLSSSTEPEIMYQLEIGSDQGILDQSL